MNTIQTVDRIGLLKAQIADATEEVNHLRDGLIETEGASRLEGNLFRVALTNSLRSTTDWKAGALAMAKKAGVSDKVFENNIAANTACAPVWTMRVNARINGGTPTGSPTRPAPRRAFL